MPRFKVKLSAIGKYVGWYQIEVEAKNELQAIKEAMEGFDEAKFIDHELGDIDFETIEISDIIRFKGGGGVKK